MAIDNSTPVIVIPIYDDWVAVTRLIGQLEDVLSETELRPHLLLVNDCSNEPIPVGLASLQITAIRSIEVLDLRANVGHQRAIAVGLCHLASRGCPAAIVMDGDGEDSPEDVPRLYRRMMANGALKIVFGSRRRRSEGLGFRLAYWCYRQIHLLLTGIPVRVGNFSAIPGSLLPRMTVAPELWNHYAASVFKNRIPFESIPVDRATRLAGESKMNYISLTVHGLSALAVFGDRICVRLAALFAAMIATETLFAVTAAAIALLTTIALPDSLWTALAMTAVISLQTIGFCGLLAFLILQNRMLSGFLPSRDYVHFVDRIRLILSAEPAHQENGNYLVPQETR